MNRFKFARWHGDAPISPMRAPFLGFASRRPGMVAWTETKAQR